MYFDWTLHIHLHKGWTLAVIGLIEMIALMIMTQYSVKPGTRWDYWKDIFEAMTDGGDAVEIIIKFVLIALFLPGLISLLLFDWVIVMVCYWVYLLVRSIRLACVMRSISETDRSFFRSCVQLNAEIKRHSRMRSKIMMDHDKASSDTRSYLSEQITRLQGDKEVAWETISKPSQVLLLPFRPTA